MSRRPRASSRASFPARSFLPRRAQILAQSRDVLASHEANGGTAREIPVEFPCGGCVEDLTSADGPNMVTAMPSTRQDHRLPVLRCALPTCRRPLLSVLYVREGQGYCSHACAEWRGPDRRQTWRSVVDDGIPLEGETTMSMDEVTDARHRARQWLEDGERVLTVLLTVLNDYDRLNDRLGATERENAKLQAVVLDNEDLRRRLELAERESERLREEVCQSLTELERGAREREEIADQLSRVVNDALARLRSQRSAYASESAAGVKAASL